MTKEMISDFKSSSAVKTSEWIQFITGTQLCGVGVRRRDQKLFEKKNKTGGSVFFALRKNK